MRFSHHHNHHNYNGTAIPGNGEDVRAVLTAIRAKNSITLQDERTLRRLFFADGIISQWEAEMLFELNDAVTQKIPEWDIFFVEALTDYLVYQAYPRGYVTPEQAAWLIERISRDGLVEHETELELLINVLTTARWVPPLLVQFALRQVHQSVLTGEGPLRNGRALKAGVIGGTEVDLIRRIIYAMGGDDGIAVSRQEAEILFDINDATAAQENHPAWSDLFVYAIANYLMSAHGYHSYKVPTRQEMLRREAWLNEPTGGLKEFSRKAFAGGIEGVIEAWRYDPQAEAEAALEAQLALCAEAEQITEEEARWLVARIERDGKLHENEKRLLRFLKRESPKLAPQLLPLLEKVS